MMALSDAAKALLAALWVSPKFTLRYGMVKSVPSQEADDALSQLASAGLVQRTSEPGGAVVYSLTDAGVSMDRRQSMAFVKSHGSFPLSQPKPTP